MGFFLPLIFGAAAGSTGAHALTNGRSTDVAADRVADWTKEKLGNLFNNAAPGPFQDILSGLRDIGKENPALVRYGVTAAASILAYAAVSMGTENGFLGRIGGMAAALAIGMFVHGAMKDLLAEEAPKVEPSPAPAPQ